MAKILFQSFSKSLLILVCTFLVSGYAKSQAYCTPTFVNGCFSWNSSAINLNTINWTLGSTSCSLYDYTNLSTTLSAGATYPMSVTNGSWCGCAVWIDFDHSFTFDPGENLYYLYSAIANQTYNFSITIPALTPNGTYRMRVISPWGSDGFTAGPNGSGGCGSYQYGNFDDFTIIIGAPCLPTTDTVAVVTCNSYLSPSRNYTWTNSGTYLDTIPNSGGCDSIITVDLIVNTETNATISPVSCGPYTSPSGQVYTVTGVYSDTIPNAAGCDSLIRIDLTIATSSTDTIYPVVCGQYLSPSGQLLLISGNYQDTIPNASGCDSLITIELIVNSSSTHSISPNTCGPYNSPAGNIYSVSGLFQDTLVNAAGCDSIINIQLTVTAIDTGVTVSGSSLTSNMAGAAYQWLSCEGGFVVIPGETNQVFTPAQSGNYAVVVSLNGCTDSSGCHGFIATGIEKLAAKDLFSVYPNPTRNILHIRMQDASCIGSRIRLTDVMGKMIYEQVIENPGMEINVSELQNGIYFLENTGSERKTQMKIVKE